MKIKHWQGYGCVNAKKVSESVITDNEGNIVHVINVLVSGEHEWGIVPRSYDPYLVGNWLFKRFHKGYDKMLGYDVIYKDDESAIYILMY